MGLSIFYSGKIRDYGEIESLTEEVVDIACDLGWQSTAINDEHLKGILISPEKCEPAVFTFVPDGRLCSPVSIGFNKPDDPFYYTIFTKTQFAGPDSHIAVIKLLKYISKKYFSEIKVNEEGLFWETGDELVLRKQFDRYNKMPDAFREMISGLDPVEGENPQSLADRIEEIIKKR
ncbi:MAG: hypothetical protein EPN37_16225 [Chitinophagaceae bacterium]|nr:MAG: hypothetical protein EPN37_16225 [Chitinophagaceae bacterium]